MSAADPLARAETQQRLASDPAVVAWAEASAGSGKTTVLTNRVLRLLLAGVRPERLLCLTFTKVAAAEMQTRLRARLGEWSVASDGDLAKALTALTGTRPGDAALARARSLLLTVLELPGGMRVSTIHAFCQSLLRCFPLEACLSPRFAVLQGADEATLLTEARETVLATAAEDALGPLAGLVNADQFAKALLGLLEERGRERFSRALEHCAGIAGLHARLTEVLETPLDPAELIEDLCRVPDPVGRAAARLLNDKGKMRRDTADELREWLAHAPEERLARWEEWPAAFFTKQGTPYVHLAEVPELVAETSRLEALGARLATARMAAATAALTALAQPVLARFDARRRSGGGLCFGDLIDAAQRILSDPGSAWVLFKLDGGLDHLLLDEAQDSNPAQWDIADALTEAFFAGQGAERASPVARTIFAVGDPKQSIFGFQGADAGGLEEWREHYRERADAAGMRFEAVNLDVSFRSTAPVLALVDAVFADGPARTGVVAEGKALRHVAARAGAAGAVELWPLPARPEPRKPAPLEVPEATALVPDAASVLADALATRIAHLIAHHRLPARGDRPVRPGDVLVLVRKLAGVAFVPRLVRSLKARGVPVAGLSRFKLVEHIAVQDMLALLDVLLLPEDSLQLAAVLRSPLCGLSDDALFALAHGREGASLWTRLMAQRGGAGEVARVADWLASLGARVDFAPPHALLTAALLEPSLGGVARARLFARLGRDAQEPLDELLNAALTYERRYPPSLQGFVHWLRGGGAEVKREPEGAGDAVRILTVHNAKGLQAPVVVVVDVGPGGGNDTLRWHEDTTPHLPLWAPRKTLQGAAFVTAADRATARAAAEENRLLYVALTRAEDRLIVCGLPGKKGVADDTRWHRLVGAGFARLPDAAQFDFNPTAFDGSAAGFTGDPGWRLTCPQTAAPRIEAARAAAAAHLLPAWAGRAAPVEAGVETIAPAAIAGEEETPVAAPFSAGDPRGLRFRRGRLVHALLQTLPDHPAGERAAIGARFLARPGHGLSSAEQAATLAEVLALFDVPAIAAAFGPDTRAEAPIAGRIGGRDILGQVDRLLVGPDRVLVLDYKTSRPPPATPDAVAPLYLRQMAAYRAVLRAAFPGRAVACALVWTLGARCMPLPDALLDAHAPRAG